MRALARDGGVFVHVGVRGRDGQATGVDSLGCGSSMGSVEFDMWDSEMGESCCLENVDFVLITRRRKRRKKAEIRMSLVLKGD